MNAMPPLSASDMHSVSQLLATRDALRWLHRDDYVDLVAPFRAVVRRVAQQLQLEPLRAALHVIARANDDVAHMWMLAAAVDEIEAQSAIGRPA